MIWVISSVLGCAGGCLLGIVFMFLLLRESNARRLTRVKWEADEAVRRARAEVEYWRDLAAVDPLCVRIEERGRGPRWLRFHALNKDLAYRVLQRAARGVSFSERDMAVLIDRSQFEKFRDELISGGLLAWRGEHRQGVAWTEAGRACRVVLRVLWGAEW